MATERIVTVKSSGGDYTSLSAAESGEQGDLVGLDRQLTIECYPMLDTSPVLISGSITDAARYIKVSSPAGLRHPGYYDDSAYRMEAAADHLLDNQDDYTVIEWLQIFNTKTSSGWYAVVNTNNSTDPTFRYNVVRADTATAGIPIGFQTYGTSAHICRNIIYDFSAYAGRGIYLHGASHEAVHNTVFNCYNGIDCEGYAATIKQNYSGNSNYCYYDVGNTTHSKNISSDSSSPDGASYQGRNSYSDYFVDYANRDFHLRATDTVLKDAGDDLGSPYDNDIDGEQVIGAWDIGADEYMSAGGQSLKKVISETEQLSEARQRNLAMKRVMAETLVISEDILYFISTAIVKVISEALDVSEGVLRYLGVLKVIGEDMNLAENMSRRLSLKRRVAETVQLSEGILRRGALRRVLAESMDIPEAALRALGLRRLVSETLRVAESVIRRSAIVRIVDESLSIIEGGIKAFGVATGLIIETLRRVFTKDTKRRAFPLDTKRREFRVR